ncbi:MAG: 4'-phosphopantetheinyl transferase family protein [Anaerolineales bacterium]
MKANDHPQIPSIKPGEVHVWLFSLEEPYKETTAWSQLLSREEINRAERYRFKKDRMRFVARRGILRQLLGHYCKTDPAGINYQVNPYGKPSLASNPLSFNLSKSGDWIAYVFTLEKDLGVDIEQVRPHTDLALLAKSAFSQEEQEELKALPPSLQVEAFYHTWTQKEAFIKAKGLGLTQPLKDFSVSVDPGKPGRLVSIKDSVNEVSSWKMTCFKPGTDCWAALCVQTDTKIEVRIKAAEVSDFMQSVSSANSSQSV